jgi:hypothetical protein
MIGLLLNFIAIFIAILKFSLTKDEKYDIKKGFSLILENYLYNKNQKNNIKKGEKKMKIMKFSLFLAATFKDTLVEFAVKVPEFYRLWKKIEGEKN